MKNAIQSYLELAYLQCVIGSKVEEARQGAAKVLLNIIQKEPEIVKHVLSEACYAYP